MSSTVAFFPTTDLSDAHPDKTRALSIQFQDFGARRQFAGRVRTAVTMEDTKLIKEALFGTPGNGDVIVFDGGGSLRTALLGDKMAARLIDNGWSGIVINGAVRDSAELGRLDLGIKALSTSPVRPNQQGIGGIDVPIALGHVLIKPGDTIYCDADGVLVTEDPIGL